jgi:hypothetical protein
MGKRSATPDQLGFSFEPPVLATLPAALAGLERQVSEAASDILHGDERSREVIAAEMSRLLGEDVSRAMLDAYASPAREGHKVPMSRFLGLVAVTDRHDILDRLLRPIGAALQGLQQPGIAEQADTDADLVVPAADFLQGFDFGMLGLVDDDQGIAQCRHALPDPLRELARPTFRVALTHFVQQFGQHRTEAGSRRRERDHVNVREADLELLGRLGFAQARRESRASDPTEPLCEGEHVSELFARLGREIFRPLGHIEFDLRLRGEHLAVAENLIRHLLVWR